MRASVEILFIPPEKVKPNPYQPRRFFDPVELDELAASIRTYGLLQPISVRLINGVCYELIAGERRLRASKLAGLAVVPAILVEINDLDSAVLAMIENLQRANLHFFEEAEGFHNLIGEYAFTQEALALRMGKTQSTIANKLRLLRLPRHVQKAVVENGLTERHARALLKLEKDEDRLDAIAKIAAERLTVSKTEELIEEKMRARRAPTRKPIPFKAYIRDIRILTNSIRENLEIVRRAGMESHLDIQQTETGYNISITVNCASPGENAGQAKAV